MTVFSKGRVARCTLNKIGERVRYLPDGVSNDVVSDPNNGTAFNRSG